MITIARLAAWMRIPYLDGGRTSAGCDCYGLHRLITSEVTGQVLDEWSGTTEGLAIARTLGAEAAAEGWREIPAGEERVCDLVLMTGVAGAGRSARVVPMHVGTVIRPAVMIDIEIGRSAMVRAFRATPTRAAHPTMGRRLIGVYRPACLEEWTQ